MVLERINGPFQSLQTLSSVFLTSESLHGLDEEPHILTIRRFCRELAHKNMESLQEAHIVDATCWNSGTHKFLLMSVIAAPYALNLQKRRVWMKIERRPSRAVLSSPSGAVPALDSVSLSSEHSSLKHANDHEVMRCTFQDLKVKHVADLLDIVGDVCPQYVPTSYNSWFHAAVILGSLQNFGREWTKKPRRDVIRLLVGFLGDPATREITRRFHRLWPPKASAPFVLLTSEEVWDPLPRPQRTGTIQLSTQRFSRFRSPQSPLNPSVTGPSTLPPVLLPITTVLPLAGNAVTSTHSTSSHFSIVLDSDSVPRTHIDIGRGASEDDLQILGELPTATRLPTSFHNLSATSVHSAFSDFSIISDSASVASTLSLRQLVSYLSMTLFPRTAMSCPVSSLWSTDMYDSVERRVITRMERRRTIDQIVVGVYHEFVVLRVEDHGVPDEGALGAGESSSELWVRLERGANKRVRGWESLFGVFTADDTAIIARSQAQIASDEISVLLAQVKFVTYPPLGSLVILLQAVHEISPLYKLLWENCWFFGSVVQEFLTTRGGGQLVYGDLSHVGNTAEARQKVFERADGMLGR